MGWFGHIILIQVGNIGFVQKEYQKMGDWGSDTSNRYLGIDG